MERAMEWPTEAAVNKAVGATATFGILGLTVDQISSLTMAICTVVSLVFAIYLGLSRLKHMRLNSEAYIKALEESKKDKNQPVKQPPVL